MLASLTNVMNSVSEAILVLSMKWNISLPKHTDVSFSRAPIVCINNYTHTHTHTLKNIGQNFFNLLAMLKTLNQYSDSKS